MDILKLLRAIEFEEINKDFNQLSKRDDKNNISIYTQLINKDEQMSFKQFEEFEDEKKIKEYFNKQEDKSKYKDYYYRLYQLKKDFSNKNFDKSRKHKIVYFMYAAYINMTKNYKNFKNEKSFFIEKNKKINWIALNDGPVISRINNKKIYNRFSEDKTIEINFNNFSKEMKEFFILLLKNFSLIGTNKLIEESKKTEPWKESYKGGFSDPISENLIISFFEKNEPFFFGEQDEKK